MISKKQPSPFQHDIPENNTACLKQYHALYGMHFPAFQPQHGAVSKDLGLSLGKSQPDTGRVQWIKYEHGDDQTPACLGV